MNRATRVIGLLVLVACFSAVAVEKGAEENTEKENKLASLKQLYSDQKILSDQVQEIRRDQLNYKVEKEVLKEGFTASVSTLNSALTVALLIFTGLGALGLSQLRELKRDMDSELEEIRTLKANYGASLLKLRKRLRGLEAQSQKHDKVNQSQDQRLKVLELQERAMAQYNSGAYAAALEYANLALEITPDAFPLWLLKGNTLGKMGDFKGAADALTKATEKNPEDKMASINEAEFRFLLGDLKGAQAIVRRMKEKLQEERPWVPGYFDFLTHFHLNEKEKMREAAQSLAATYLAASAKSKRTWGWFEFELFVDSMQPGKDKDYLAKLVEVLNEKIPLKELN